MSCYTPSTSEEFRNAMFSPELHQRALWLYRDARDFHASSEQWYQFYLAHSDQEDAFRMLADRLGKRLGPRYGMWDLVRDLLKMLP